jgi:hypothetical protein
LLGLAIPVAEWNADHLWRSLAGKSAQGQKGGDNFFHLQPFLS